MASNQPPKPGSKNKNLVLLGVLFLLVGVGGTYQFLAPNLKTAKQELENVTSELKGLETDVQVLTTAKAQMATAKEKMTVERGVNFDKIPVVFPFTEDVPGIYLQMEALMNYASGIGIKNAVYQVGAPAVDGQQNVVHIPISISGIGTYNNIKSFINKAETNLRPITIVTINLAESLDKDKGVPTGDFSMSISGIIRAQNLSPAYTK